MKNKGFTLIELVVTVIIIALLTAALLVMSRTGGAEAALFRSAQRLALDISRQRSNALSAKEFSGEVPCGYGINFNLGSPGSYIIFADRASDPACATEDHRYTGPGEMIQEVFLEHGVVITSPLNNTDIVFKSPEPQVFFNPGPGAAEIILGSSKTSVTKRVIVTLAGQIYIE
ncbi:MAG: prepilin-type N-terminal cleavage/methylation domain-containing protein [bacterium]|nr:prepilin-type N-terminal cleavage/methylation domain-containing protein [bacterium]